MKTIQTIKQYWFPVLFPLILCLIYYVEQSQHLDFGVYGVFPQKASGLKGIVLMHFVHGSADHLYSNIIPLFVLGFALFTFYKEVAFQVFVASMIMSGLWVWVAARPSYHIGASALIYALASFLFASGVIRKNIKLMSISLLVVLLYGSLIWGVFPMKPHISWEGHLYGLIAGVILAIYYRKIGLQREKFSWEEEEDEEDELEDKYWEEYFTDDWDRHQPFSNPTQGPYKIVYHLKSNDSDDVDR